MKEFIEKIKVTSLEIIVTGTVDKHYFEIKYKEVGRKDYNIGYSSYDLNNVFGWKEDCFEIVNQLAEEYNNGWIPCSERFPEDCDNRYYMCIVENHEEDLPMFCQYDEEYGFGFWYDIYDEHTLGFVDSEFKTNEELGYEKVIAWQPLPQPYQPKGE